MIKGIKRVGICLLIAALFWCGSVIADRQKLRRDLIRIHVVANSDSESDQALKLKVRDAVSERLRRELKNVADPQAAKQYLREKLPVLQSVAEDTLRAFGCEDDVTVSLQEEFFDTRKLESVQLPAGVYAALRFTIGEGGGKNWWGVLFPGFLGEEKTVETGAYLSNGLEETLEGEYTIRFACLEALGKLENIFFGG